MGEGLATAVGLGAVQAACKMDVIFSRYWSETFLFHCGEKSLKFT